MPFELDGPGVQLCELGTFSDERISVRKPLPRVINKFCESMYQIKALGEKYKISFNLCHYYFSAQMYDDC